MTAIDVQLRAEWVENVGYRYDVLLDGEVIVHRSRDPEYDAARVLHARGLSGRFRTIDFRTGKPRMILDIEKAARLCTVERTGRDLWSRPIAHWMPRPSPSSTVRPFTQDALFRVGRPPPKYRRRVRTQRR